MVLYKQQFQASENMTDCFPKVHFINEGLWTNGRQVSRSRDHSGPMRGQYLLYNEGVCLKYLHIIRPRADLATCGKSEKLSGIEERVGAIYAQQINKHWLRQCCTTLMKMLYVTNNQRALAHIILASDWSVQYRPLIGERCWGYTFLSK